MNKKFKTTGMNNISSPPSSSLYNRPFLSVRIKSPFIVWGTTNDKTEKETKPFISSHL